MNLIRKGAAFAGVAAIALSALVSTASATAPATCEHVMLASANSISVDYIALNKLALAAYKAGYQDAQGSSAPTYAVAAELKTLNAKEQDSVGTLAGAAVSCGLH